MLWWSRIRRRHSLSMLTLYVVILNVMRYQIALHFLIRRCFIQLKLLLLGIPVDNQQASHAYSVYSKQHGQVQRLPLVPHHLQWVISYLRERPKSSWLRVCESAMCYSVCTAAACNSVAITMFHARLTASIKRAWRVALLTARGRSLNTVAAVYGTKKAKLRWSAPSGGWRNM